MNFVATFPVELSQHIFSFLDYSSFQNALLVAKSWKAAAQSEILQKTVYYSQFHFGRDPDFYHSTPLEQLKNISTNFKFWIYKSYSIRSKSGVVFWGRSGPKTVWCSPKDRLRALYKVNIETKKSFCAASFPSEIIKAEINKRHVVAAADRIYHLHFKERQSFESVPLDEMKFVWRKFWLYQDLLLIGVDDAQFKGSFKNVVNGYVLVDLITKERTMFPVSPSVVSDLTFLNREYAAVFSDGWALCEIHGNRAMSPLFRERKAVLYHLFEGEPVMHVNLPYSSVLRRVNDKVYVVNQLRYDKQGLMLLRGERWDQSKFMPIKKEIEDISILSDERVLLISKKFLESNASAYNLSLFSLKSQKIICEQELLAGCQPVSFDFKWGQISYICKDMIWVYDFASQETAPVFINI